MKQQAVQNCLVRVYLTSTYPFYLSFNASEQDKNTEKSFYHPDYLIPVQGGSEGRCIQFQIEYILSNHILPSRETINQYGHIN